MTEHNIIEDNARRVVDALKGRGWRVSFAESCTGGLCCSYLVGVPDASCVLDASFVTYANDAKVKYLGVRGDSIIEHGVVSESVVSEMAEGAASANGCEVGVGISGIAGPSGAVPGKPVGTVCFGFYINGSVYTETVEFGDIGRNNVREKSVAHVYSRLRKLLVDN